jgi:tetratricopeptide (TPR) repeat protein
VKAGRRLVLAGLLAASAAAAVAGAGDQAYRRGIAALDHNRPRIAQVELANALQAEPGHRQARLARARAFLLLGDGIAAEADIRALREAGVAQAETAHLLAHALLLMGQNDRAAAEAARAAPAHAAYAARIAGRAYRALGDNERAAAEFARAAAAGPGDSMVWTDIAQFRLATGEMAGAIEAVDRAVGLDPRNVEALTLRGEVSRGQHGLAAALPWFDRALAIDPDNVPALLERAGTLGDVGRMRDMLRDSRRALELSPGHPMAYYFQAMLAARAGDWELAGSIWELTAGRLDELPAGMLLASAIDYQSGRPEQAAQRLARLVERQPANRKARRLLAAARWRSGDVAGTVAALQPLADRADGDSYSLTLIGRALERQGNGAAAARYLARAARPQQRMLTALDSGLVSDEQIAALRSAAGGGDAGAEIALIGALLRRGLGAEALDRARRLQAAHPGAPDAHLLVGDSLGIAGDFAGAAVEYRRAAAIAFTEPVAMRLIEALRRSGQPDAATDMLNLFLEQNPRNVPALVLAAASHMQARDWDNAIDVYEDLRARLGDGDSTILNNLAWAYSEVGESDEAIPIARRAWELDRSNPATGDTLGWILFKSGARAEGLALLQQAARGARAAGAN